LEKKEGAEAFRKYSIFFHIKKKEGATHHVAFLYSTGLLGAINLIVFKTHNVRVCVCGCMCFITLAYNKGGKQKLKISQENKNLKKEKNTTKINKRHAAQFWQIALCLHSGRHEYMRVCYF